MPKLGVNIDHVASIRELRKGNEPDPVLAALVSESAGAESIVVHLREDRRHIKERDLFILRNVLKVKFNLEMSVAKDIVDIACKVKPDQATLVPERRQELTTEGGLDVALNLKKIKDVVSRLKKSGIEVSLFIDPDKRQINAAKKTKVKMIELHTGRYAEAKSKAEVKESLKEIEAATKYAKSKGLTVNAGHGLDYRNVGSIAEIKGIKELNIGYSIISRAVFAGLDKAVREMKHLI